MSASSSHQKAAPVAEAAPSAAKPAEVVETASSSSPPVKKQPHSHHHHHHHHSSAKECERARVILFWLCALGYMAPWTFIGSLIALFKKARDANYYVELYAVYYATGMPTSLLQERYDSYWDAKLGSSRTYLVRGQLTFVVIVACVLLMPFVMLDRWPMLLVMALLGVSSWLLHGTACMLASMTSIGSISALQTGFRTPEILAIIACYGLNVGSTASPNAIRVFFLIIAVLAVCGLVAWTTLVLSRRVLALLADKDRAIGHDLAAKVPLLSSDQTDEEASASALTQADKEAIALHIRPCRVALFWTMFGSIFTAAFFAYCDSSTGVDIEQVLYFTRLFGDLGGRPFTSLPRPSWLRTPNQLALFAIARLVFAVAFFAYVFVPAIPKSDAFVVLDIAVFSITSGYIGIISYEYAARDYKAPAAKTYAATLMNTTFQLSMFLAVLLGILISEVIS